MNSLPGRFSRLVLALWSLLLCFAATGAPQGPCGGDTLRVQDVLLPAVAVGACALFAHVDRLEARRNALHAVLSARGRHTTRVDDYLQYTPLAAVYALDACGVPARHTIKDRTLLLAISYATMGALVNGLKYTVRELRPDGSARNSFPSGHTATAFMGAEFLRWEYRDVSPWIGYGGYAVAAVTGYLRIYNDRHWFNDVVAGAALGVLSAQFAYWLYPRLRGERRRRPGDAVVWAVPTLGAAGLGASVGVVF